MHAWIKAIKMNWVEQERDEHYYVQYNQARKKAPRIRETIESKEPLIYIMREHHMEPFWNL